MLRKSIIYALAFFSSGVSVAQNLVPNPGFEIYNNCPPNRSTIVYSPDYTLFPTAIGWVSALSNTTPDYYHTCATNPLVQVPFNTYNGYQETHGGNAYAGIAVASGFPKTPILSDYREYLEVRLTQPLAAGKRYYLSFFVNMVFHKPESTTEIVIDMIGARFTDTQLHASFPPGVTEFYLPGPPDICNPRNTFLVDTASWANVTGIYTARGGEQWLTIGYFKDSLPIHYTTLYSPASDPDSIHSTCYMYVDDVCVREVPTPTHDTLYVNSFPVAIGALQDGRHEWNTGDSTSSITISGPGTYWVLTTDDCLYRTDTTTIICNMDSSVRTTTVSVSLFPAEISSSLVGGTHIWNTGAGSHSIIVNTPGTYWVESYYNCMHRIDTINISCKEDTIYHQSVIYTASFPLLLTSPQTGDSLRWNNTDTSAKIQVNGPGMYHLIVWQGCRRYINMIQVMTQTIEECLWLPSAFTPNGDGKNDQFGPVNSCNIQLPYYNLSIYNRFGECVFDTKDVTEKWDGKFRSNNQDVGAYYYMMRYSTKDKAKAADAVLKKGDLTLIR